MSRMPQLTAETANDEQRALLEDTNRQLGRVPNLYAAMANGPAALKGYLAMRDALVAGSFRARVREQLALLIAQENECGYCVAAHTMRGGKVGLSEEQLLATRRAESDDPHTTAVLQVAREAMRSGGRLTDDVVEQARAAGVTDAELAEIIGHIALNVFSNYFNHLAQPDLDFPAVDVAVTASH
ncbi:carboxymuconolactone decarboxylase family protein [Solihabitans fulvus]|uniref:Carboxymuconolactone decarboxylase family protein n=1 Tax=Solihabitans fulvus TaxID=1892852 RepID=A0A5B2WSL4_9PSEU|nr:carboxymuconolactone decarboxylase family protein [Solihabitans fulvus]KAA2253948.1 carboxymuconolactone decarboxylase family protein [Solihabitans fulvus]